MPPRAMPTGADMMRVWQELRDRKFFPVQGLEYFYLTEKDAKMVPPTPRRGRVLSFMYVKGDMEVVVNTTYVLDLHTARPNSHGWIIIVQKERGLRKQRKKFVPLKRTAGFIEALIEEAKIARNRVRHRPKCPNCGALMDMAYGRGLGARFWRCPYHPEERADWDTPEFLESLPESAKERLKTRRSKRKSHQDARRKRGQPINVAMLRKKTWQRIEVPPEGF